MGNRFIRSCFFFILVLALTGLVSGAPPTTDCVLNPDRPACQQPLYTDDQDEYWFDLRASSVFNNGEPDVEGVTLLHGGEAGSLENTQTDSVSGNQKTEYYIQDGGEADTDSFGLGSLESTGISISGGLQGSDGLG